MTGLAQSMRPLLTATVFATYSAQDIILASNGAELALEDRPVVGPVPALGGARVAGVAEPGHAAFRGIPFAQPPVDELRWKPSVPYVPATDVGTFDASWNGPACYQHGAAEGQSSSESEDCLFLNVFVPDSNGSCNSSRPPLPVMFWIHGGMNTMGSAASYGPVETLAADGQVVLVVPQYRLHLLGFLALEELAEADPRGVSGNYGITDLQLALRWVQGNIQTFGGDPGQVTIIGQSSGGTNVLSLIAGETNKGLFHRAISLSGSPNISMDRRSKERQDRIVVKHSSCKGKVGEALRRCLVALSPAEIYAAAPPNYGFFYSLYDYPVNHEGLAMRTDKAGNLVGVGVLVYVDGVTITRPLVESLASGVNDVPLLLQSTQTEMACDPDRRLTNIDGPGLKRFFHQQFQTAYGQSFANDVFNTYSNLMQEFSPEYAAYAVDADTASGCGLQELAKAAARSFRSPVYWGTVTATASSPVDGQRLAFHAWDSTAAFKAWDGHPTLGVRGHHPVNSYYTPNADDKAFGERVLRHWTQFAQDGKLSENEWQRVLSGSPPVSSIIGPTSTVPVPGLKVEICDFWKSNGVNEIWWWIN